MSTTMKHPDSGDVRRVPDVLVDKYEARGFEAQAEPSASELKGAALDEALETAGLPKSGSVADKRARLADHLASQTPA